MRLTRLASSPRAPRPPRALSRLARAQIDLQHLDNPPPPPRDPIIVSARRRPRELPRGLPRRAMPPAGACARAARNSELTCARRQVSVLGYVWGVVSLRPVRELVFGRGEDGDSEDGEPW